MRKNDRADSQVLRTQIKLDQAVRHRDVPIKRRGYKKSVRAEIEEAPEYITGTEYTREDLARMADKILLEDAAKDDPEFERGLLGPGILHDEQIELRKRREIYCKAGTPDPNILSGMYNRTHPRGRKFNLDRKNGKSFYR